MRFRGNLIPLSVYGVDKLRALIGSELMIRMMIMGCCLVAAWHYAMIWFGTEILRTGNGMFFFK